MPLVKGWLLNKDFSYHNKKYCFVWRDNKLKKSYLAIGLNKIPKVNWITLDNYDCIFRSGKITLALTNQKIAKARRIHLIRCGFTETVTGYNKSKHNKKQIKKTNGSHVSLKN